MPLSFASVAQLDRVSVSETEGHRFDPCRVHHKFSILSLSFINYDMLI